MKIITLGLVLLGSVFANAGTLTLTWDFPALYMQDPAIAADPTILSFKAFSKTGNASYVYSSPIWTGPNPPAKISGLQSGKSYCFVVRSHKSNNNLDSADSNEACGKVPKLTPPSGFKLVDFEAELYLGNGLIHFLGYYSNSESGEKIWMETTEKFSEL